ncbi:putative reverse transcriptase zinc-binding domain-containing protein [Helianthus annuus]|nr:putative reverse transcriptase zinc-binding domain-containing protein [Helianthus annuus]KAJ0834855.1 putative reverse transcriptase zinc-binding domain-containing protein [Helianthus annuus]
MARFPFNLCIQQKCQLFGVGVEETEINLFAKILGCRASDFPFTYLGIPIGANMKQAKFWQPVIEKFNKKLSSWKARNLSFAGRVTLAKAVLGSLPSYYLSLFAAPKVVIKKLEGLRRDFVWGKTGMRKKVRWIRWEKMIKPKTHGGIGIEGINDFNIAMRSKWWWRLKNDPKQLWAVVIDAIHKTKKNDKLVPLKKTIPGIWKDICAVEGTLHRLNIQIQEKLKVEVGDGENTRFWKDSWLLDKPLKDLFPDLFRCAADKNIKVAACMHLVGSKTLWAWDWAKSPVEHIEWSQLGEIMNLLDQFKTTGGKDKWRWENRFGVDFSAKSLRLEIITKDVPEEIVRWNPWAPPKCNLLLWRALLGRVAAKDQLIARGFTSLNGCCDRCGFGWEDTNHIFVNCLLAKSIWWEIFVWIRIPYPANINNLKDLIEVFHNSPGSKIWKRLVFTVACATVWRIWHARNVKVFESTNINYRITVSQIKEDAFFWIRHRSKVSAPSWDKWLDFDVLDCI